MKIKALTSALCVSLLMGCNTGNRDSKPYFGPGSGTPPATGTTGGGVTPGGGGGGGGGAGTAGTFNPGPAMTVARASHTATVMNDGRVLVVGGTDGQGLHPTSEVFDPVASSWTDTTQLAANPNDGVMLDSTGQFATVRQDHTANNLTTGLVLVAGGFGAERLDAQGQPVGEMLKSCYVFNTQTNSYSAAGDLTENRGWHVSALMANGSVIVMAGLDQAMSLTLTTAEVYDLQSNSWTQINPGTSSQHTLGSAVTSVNQTLVVGGVNLAVGGQGLSITGFASPAVELFNQQQGNFINGPANVGDRMEMGSDVMSTGDAFFAGGRGLDPQAQALVVVDTTEIYDPTAQAFTAGPTLGVGRAAPEVAEIGTSSDMLIVGGIDASGVPTAVCEVYGVLNNVILGTVNMSTERVDHSAVTLQNGQILVVGGNDANGTPVDSTEIHTR